jgi:hypothetical protein
MRRGILASREELASLRDRLGRKPFDGIYEALRSRCALILEASPISESQWRTLWEHGSWDSALHAARTAQGRIVDLLVAHHVDRNQAYRDRAIEELRNLVAWSTWVDPCNGPLPADQCTAEAAVGAVLGLDWLWEDLPEPDRRRALRAIAEKAVEPYIKAVRQKVWWYSCYHNWNAVVNSGCAMAGLALSDRDPHGQEAFGLGMVGLKNFFDALGREGGWDEGIGYWGTAIRYVLLLGEAASRLLDDKRIFHVRGMDVTGLFPIYFTPGGQAASFGDYPGVPLWGALYLLVKHLGQDELAWWLDTYAFHRDASASGWSAPGFAMLFRPRDLETPKSANLAPLKVYHEIGWAAMADRWPRPGFYVAAKTGDLSANHSQHDMNSIQLQADGEMLLHDPGPAPHGRDYYSDARSRFYQVQARAHNTIIVGDRDHQIDARGQVVEAEAGGDYRWVACDAETACGDNVRFIRHVVMVLDASGTEGRTLVVLDEIKNDVPEKVDLFWHTPGHIQPHASIATGQIVGRQAKLYYWLGGTVDVRISQESQQLDARRTDEVLRVSAEVANRAMFLSVFSRNSLSGAVALKESASGEVAVTASGVLIVFQSQKTHLRLERVTANS